MKSRIVIIGCNKELIDPIEAVFKRHKYAVRTAASAEDALMEIKDFSPHAVIHAVDSPRKECLKICETLRKEKSTKDLPIIMISRKRTDKSALVFCLGKGATDAFRKPSDKTDLILKVKDEIKMGFLFEEVKENREDLSALLDMTRSLSSTLNFKELLYLIVKKISDVINVARCSIVRIDPDSKYGIVVASHEDPGIRDIKIDLRKYPEVKKALEIKDIVIVKNIWKDPLMAKVKRYLEKIKFDSIVVIPVIYREEVIGTLILRTSRVGAAFKEKEIRFCKVVANVAAGALYNAYLYEVIEEEKTMLQKLAITDDLTGVYNHRYFAYRFQEEFDRVKRYDHPLSLIMLDIDYFKVINDTYGHRKGDMILKEFARVLKKNIRNIDILARYGGEEFVILLPQTDRAGAFIEAERIRKIIKEHDYKIKDVKITVSLGIATYPCEGIKTQDDLMGCADQALYIAKSRGRDTTEMFRH